MKMNGSPSHALNDDRNIIGIPVDAVVDLAIYPDDGNKIDLLRYLVGGACLNIRFTDMSQIGTTDWIQIGNADEIKDWPDIDPQELMRERLTDQEPGD